MHHGGTFFLPHAFNFLIRSDFGRKREKPGTPRLKPFDHGTQDGYKFFLEMGSLANANKKYFNGERAFWNEWMQHGNYDEYWKAQNVTQHLKKVSPAVMTVGGWFDAEDLPGPLKIYEAVEQNNAKTYNTLVMGPWCHGCWARGNFDSLGGVNFGSQVSAYYQANIELPFFNYFLKDKGDNRLPEAYVFETGTNQWKQYDQWPPKGAQPASLYLQANGKLGFDTPKVESRAAFDEYISDPAKPVPHSNAISIGMQGDYMIYDQRFAATRPDVLVYQTDVLTDNLTLAGPLNPELFVSTSGTDSDYVVKLIDVFPDKDVNAKMNGYQMLVRGEPIRAKFRNSFEKPEPMKPHQITRVPLYLPDVNHTFQKGHRVMIQIQSTWFPLMDRNPQKFMDIYNASDTDFQKATQRVYRSSKYSTQLKVHVLK